MDLKNYNCSELLFKECIHFLDLVTYHFCFEGRIIHRYILHTEAKIRNLSKNSHFENLRFDKIHILKISILIIVRVLKI